jgi:hypothetical protein
MYAWRVTLPSLCAFNQAWNELEEDVVPLPWALPPESLDPLLPALLVPLPLAPALLPGPVLLPVPVPALPLLAPPLVPVPPVDPFD